MRKREMMVEVADFFGDGAVAIKKDRRLEMIQARFTAKSASQGSTRCPDSAAAMPVMQR